MVITQPTTLPFSLAVAALNCWTNWPGLRPAPPRAGPSGGAGVALPPGAMTLIRLTTSFLAMLLHLPPARFAATGGGCVFRPRRDAGLGGQRSWLVPAGGPAGVESIDGRFSRANGRLRAKKAAYLFVSASFISSPTF